MRLLIINTLPKEHLLAEKAICRLEEKTAECKTFYIKDMKITPCIGCNACWLKTPGICAVKDDYEQILRAYLQYDVTVFISDTTLGCPAALCRECARDYAGVFSRCICKGTAGNPNILSPAGRIPGSISRTMLRRILKNASGTAWMCVWRNDHQRRYVRSQPDGRKTRSKTVAAICGSRTAVWKGWLFPA